MSLRKHHMSPARITENIEDLDKLDRRSLPNKKSFIKTNTRISGMFSGEILGRSLEVSLSPDGN